MKFLKAIAVVFLIAAGFWACQKELEFDGGSVGAFKKDAGGGCLPVVVNGVFQVDTIIKTNVNYVDVEVIATVGGSFTIKSDTVNGYSFFKTGNVGTGVNTIRLYATGKPLVAGTNIFTIKYGTSTCTFSIPVAGSATGGAIYTLGGAPGNCSGFTLGGTYTQGTALGAGNTATVEVNVTQIGTYTLGAVSVNGMIFTSTGTFTTTGVQNVILSGSGTPLAAGTFNVVASNGTSNCTFSVTVLPAGGGSAAFTLNSAAGLCSGATQNGTYVAGTALNATNNVTINVTVTALGSYAITSTSANGMTFGAAGTFTTLGSQPVNLSGVGTPTAAGTNNFTATAGASTCTFSVITSPVTPPPANTDYIPETAGTNYSEKKVGGAPGDTSFTKVNATPIVKGANTYKIFEDFLVTTPTDSTYRRKNGGMYYMLFDQDYGFDNPFNTDGLVLDSSLGIGANWVINLGSNTVGGTPAQGTINTTILDKGATEVIEGNTYTNVIKVVYVYRYNVGAGNVDYFREEIWYAKGKGIIHEIVNDVPVTLTEQYNVTRIQVL